MKHSSQTRDGRPCVKSPILIILVFLALLLLCPASLRAKPMSSGQAERVVNGWLKLNPNPLQTPLGNQVSQVDVFGDDTGEAIYYVIYLQPAGFVIVPADDLVEPVIAFADDGTYDPSDDNPLGALVSRDLPGRVAAARALQATSAQTQKKTLTEQQVALEKACFKAEVKWAELQDSADMVGTLGIGSISDVWVAPLLQSKWSQSNVCGEACYNYYTPPYEDGNSSNYVCGCVATAIAQLIRYHEYPTSGIGVHEFTIYIESVSTTAFTRGGDGSGGPYNWNEMVLEPGCGITPAQRQAIGALCYDAGVSVNMNYGPFSSGAGLLKTKDELPDTFGYSNAIAGFDGSELSGPSLNGMANPNLDANHPVLLAIRRPGGGHAVVSDGYGYDNSTLYHHLNMGWGGSSDAWYNLPDILNYDTVDECIYNIFTSGSGEIISGRVTDGTFGDPISGAEVTAQRTGGGTYNAVTNSNGIYALAKIPSASTYDISVTKFGCSFTDQNVATGTSTNYNDTSGNVWGVDFVGILGPSPPTADSDTISIEHGVAKTIDLQASDEGLPDPPGVLTYIITSLPSHSTLDDPCASAIRSIPYTLAGNGNQMVYSPCIVYAGSDSFDFKVNDGGTPPDGGDSNIATITINVQPPAPTVVYETDFNEALPAGWSIVDGGTSSDTWTHTNPGGWSSSYWTGTFMIVDSDYAGFVDMDEQLITHSIDCSDLVDVTLKFNHDFYRYTDEVADVDIRVDGGAWQNVARYQGADAYGQVELDLSSIADGDPNVHIRWHYYNAYWDWFWGIDDVQLIATASLQPIPGDFEPDCDVDLYDFAVLALAWLGSPGSGNWNPACDISDPNDSVIDELDLAVFTENWLTGL